MSKENSVVGEGQMKDRERWCSCENESNRRKRGNKKGGQQVVSVRRALHVLNSSRSNVCVCGSDRQEKTMKILGIETSCDETAAAIVEDGRGALSNVIASQVDLHKPYGGIVPEVASREHLLKIIPVIKEAVNNAGVDLKDIDGIAVTYGPGLAGSLLVGVNVAKSLAMSLGLPLYGVNHLKGHIYAAWIMGDPPEAKAAFPFVCLVASGGHTELLLMRNYRDFTLLGQTRDDAAGEALDKAARILGLGYPGGPAIQKAAEGVCPKEQMPRAWLPGSLDFSFSGVKTAVLNKARNLGLLEGNNHTEAQETTARELAAAFQESIVDVLVNKTIAAVKKTGAHGVIMGGGVTANLLLRERMAIAADGLPVIVPSPNLSVDNGAMIAAAAYFENVPVGPDGLDLDIVPSLSIV